MVEIGDSDRLDDPKLQLYLCRWKHGWWGRWCLKRAAWNGSKLRLVEDRARDEVDEAVNASPKYGKHGGFVLFSELWRCKFALPGALGSFWEPNGSNMPWLVWRSKATATPDLQDEALDYSESWTRIRVGMSPMVTIGWRSQVFISWVSSCSCSLLLHLCKSVLCWMS